MYAYFIIMAMRGPHLANARDKIDPAYLERTPRQHDIYALMNFIDGNAVPCVEWLLRRYPQLAQERNSSGHTPLHIACCYYPQTEQKRRLQIVRMLCEAGAPLESHCVIARGLQGTPLDILGGACYHPVLVEPVALMLVEYGADASAWQTCAKIPTIYAAWLARKQAIAARGQALRAFLRCLRHSVPILDLRKMLVLRCGLYSRFSWREWLLH